MEGMKVGDVVVVVKAYPSDHNGEIGTVSVFKGNMVRVVLQSTRGSWDCLKVRPATLLEKELAEL